MWVVLKYKKKEFNFLKNDFTQKLGELPIIFRPKIRYQKLIRNKMKFFEKDILDDYLICFHKKFSNAKILEILKNSRGLKYFLIDSQTNQKEIVHFINHCKNNQGPDGYIQQSFFNFSNITKGIFLNGPFANIVFNVIENQKNKLKILIGNATTIIKKNSEYLYYPI